MPPVLVDHFLFQLDSRLDKSPRTMTDEALSKFRGHGWSGNVRELNNTCDAERIEAAHVLFSFEVPDSMKGTTNLGQPGLRGSSQLLHPMLDAYEKQLFNEALSTSRRIRKAAKTLVISHTALLSKVKKQRLGASSQNGASLTK